MTVPAMVKSGSIFPKTSSHSQPPHTALASDVGRLCLVIGCLILDFPHHPIPASFSPAPFSSLPFATYPPPPQPFFSPVLALSPSLLTHHPSHFSLCLPSLSHSPLYSLSIPPFSLSLSIFPLPAIPLFTPSHTPFV